MADPKPLSKLSHAELYNMRSAPGADQQMLAPFEHRAFAREYVQENPLIAALALPFLIPGYTVAKSLNLQKARTPASLDQMFAGYHGYVEGILELLKKNPTLAKRFFKEAPDGDTKSR